MAKRTQFDFKFKDNITSTELQKMQIIQNHAIISLLNLQVGSTAQALLNTAAMDRYKNKITPYVDVSTPKVVYSKPMPARTNNRIIWYAVIAIVLLGLAVLYLNSLK